MKRKTLLLILISPSGLSSPTGTGRARCGACQTTTPCPRLGRVTSGGGCHVMRGQILNTDIIVISGQTPASQWAWPPDSVTPPSLSSPPTGDIMGRWGHVSITFVRVHCNKELIVICVETPSSGGGHSRGHNRRRRSPDTEGGQQELFSLSEYNHIMSDQDRDIIN